MSGSATPEPPRPHGLTAAAVLAEITAPERRCLLWLPKDGSPRRRGPADPRIGDLAALECRAGGFLVDRLDFETFRLLPLGRTVRAAVNRAARRAPPVSPGAPAAPVPA